MTARIFYISLLCMVLLAPSLSYAQSLKTPPRQPEWNTPVARAASPWNQSRALTPGPKFEAPQTGQPNRPPQYAPFQNTQTRTAEPQTPNKRPSPLEDMYASRIVDQLEQFGYDMFGVQNTPAPTDTDRFGNTPPPSGAVQNDFILQSGDELDITFSGQRTDRYIYTVNSQGIILIKDFPPISAAGRTIAQVRDAIESASASMYNTRAHISLASVRQIGVLVVGHVNKPGRKNMTVFHSALDALMASGGIKKSGSLRSVKLVRAGRSTIIDLYALILHGHTGSDLRIQDGDKIIVPAIGPTLAIAGELKTPGIFELKSAGIGMFHKPEKRARKANLNDLLEFGGGVLSPGKNRFIHMNPTPSGEEKVTTIHDAFKPVFGDGSILMVSKGEEKRSGTIELVGHTRRPGIHALHHSKTLRKLLPSRDILGKDIYPLIGVIERWNEKQMAREYSDFPLKLVLDNAYDAPLKDGDIIHLFSNAQIKTLAESPINENIEFGSIDPEAQNEDIISDSILASYLRERSTFIRGAVRSPGPYPVAEGTTLDSAIAAAGGMTLEASKKNIELTALYNDDQTDQPQTERLLINLKTDKASDILITAGDSIRINQKFKKIIDNSVMIIGEVKNPGRYDLVPGDKLSSLLRRAGGLTNQAYPDGAIFSRENERRAEESRFRAQARALKQSIAAAVQNRTDDKDINEGQISETRALARELEIAEGVGRITVTASPDILTVKPELDMLLESGDRLFIPKRTLTVRVNGEALSPAALQFRDDKSPLDYIHEAGGFSFHADKDRTFVLYPDGSAQPLSVSHWNYNPIFVPPGSTIVIPRDPKPFDFIESARDISQILANLAITSVFVDDIRDD